jgi:D-alanyl-D-alanine carboxypeptidase
VETRFTRRLSALAGTVLVTAGLATGAPAIAAASLAPSASSAPSSPPPDPTSQQLRCLLAGAVQPPVPGAELEVTGPGLRFRQAAGSFAAGGRQLRPTDAFRIASDTKTFTAVVMLRLVEQHKLRLDDLAAGYLDPTLVARIPYGSTMTVRQLLNHTSGLYDYATDPRWQQQVLSNPQRTWTPLELVDWAIDNGHPYAQPAALWHYSDTGYVLAGLIIEKVTGAQLAHAYRSLILSPLRMHDTYLEHWETPRRAALSHPYWGDIDTRFFNPSFDTFGGGGLVSTTADLTRFMHALSNGEVFEQPDTLRTMLTPTPKSLITTPQGSESYGLGIELRQVDGQTVWGHRGVWGSFMWYLPQRGITVTGTVNQAAPPHTLDTNTLRTAIRTPAPSLGRLATQAFRAGLSGSSDDESDLFSPPEGLACTALD